MDIGKFEVRSQKYDRRTLASYFVLQTSYFLTSYFLFLKLRRSSHSRRSTSRSGC